MPDYKTYMEPTHRMDTMHLCGYNAFFVYMNCKMHPLYRNLHMLTTKAGRDVHESTSLKATVYGLTMST